MQGISRLALLAALAATPAMAQDEPVDLGTIVLSALKTAAETLRTGVSVDVVQAEDLDAARDTSVAETLARLPGVTVAQQGGFGTASALRIRGADGRYLAVFVDGIKVSDPSGTTVSFDWASLTPAGIARIEVLRGSQSALWGGSAVAGVVSITTRGEIDEGLHQTVAVEGGSFGTAKLSYGLTQKSGGTELAFSASAISTEGFSAAPGGAEADGARATRLSFSVRHEVSDTLALGGALFFNDLWQEYDGYGPLCPAGLPVWITSCLNDIAGNEQSRREAGVRAFAEVTAGATVHSFDATLFNVTRDFVQGGVISAYEGQRLTLGWQATTEASEALKLVYGIDWSRETALYSNLPAGTASTEILGAFGQVLWSPSEDLDISATLRADRNSGFGTFTTGRLAFAWRPAEGTTLRAALATGFRAPSIDERFGDYPGSSPFAGNPALLPEESLSYEIGAEQTFASGASLSATLFRLEVDNLVSYKFIPAPGVSTLENLPGASVRQGVEVAGSLPLSDTLTLGLSYTYTDGRRPNGVRLAQVPLHNLNLSLDASLSDRLTGGLSLSHLAGRIDNDANTFDLVAMPDYTVLNAQVTYSLTDSAEAYLKIGNLLDTDYQAVNGYAAAGRSVSLGLQAKF